MAIFCVEAAYLIWEKQTSRNTASHFYKLLWDKNMIQRTFEQLFPFFFFLFLSLVLFPYLEPSANK